MVKVSVQVFFFFVFSKVYEILYDIQQLMENTREHGDGELLFLLFIEESLHFCIRNDLWVILGKLP